MCCHATGQDHHSHAVTLTCTSGPASAETRYWVHSAVNWVTLSVSHEGETTSMPWGCGPASMVAVVEVATAIVAVAHCMAAKFIARTRATTSVCATVVALPPARGAFLQGWTRVS